MWRQSVTSGDGVNHLLMARNGPPGPLREGTCFPKAGCRAGTVRWHALVGFGARARQVSCHRRRLSGSDVGGTHVSSPAPSALTWALTQT
jgi:hypothetical protein